ncbi:hypothetical protein BGZ65_001355 [Modicella reniformis]|uniref:Uncharacterized protein n=1 Tax=Modicella reniformis TaxID=1440133 RepID=A0A9P6ILW3_9FUNG|nr:hypothetical protein BGZ65_001355 [Modicella reniformis]
MTLAAIVMLIQTAIIYQDDSSAVAVVGCLGMAVSWIMAVALNHQEHIYEIRSSTAIFVFYIVSIGSTLTILRTHFDLLSTDRIGHHTHVFLILFIIILAIGFTVEAWPRGSTQVQQSSHTTEYDKANIFSRLTFYFYQPVVSIGCRRTLTAQDIANLLPVDLKTDQTYSELSRQWNASLRKQKCRNKEHTTSLFWVVIRSHSTALVPIIVCKLTIVMLSYTQPLLLSQLLSYLEHYEDKPLSYGIMLACGMFLISLFVALLFTYNRYQMFLLSAATKAAFISMVYRKSLRLSPGSRLKSTTGEITNHMAVDAEQWGDAFLSLATWVAIPFEIGAALFLLYRFLGWPMIAGVMGMVLLLPLQAWQAKIFEGMQTEKFLAMDQRVRMTTEVLAGIRVVKLYGWSTAFLKRILNIRRQELEALQRIGIVQAFMTIIFLSSSLIISLITFGVYAMWGGPDFTPGKLTPQTVFVSMTLFSMLKDPLSNLSNATTETISVVVATRRIRDFLLSEEIDEDDIIRFKNLPRDPDDPVILIQDASFSWENPTDGSSSNPASGEEENPLLAAVQEEDPLNLSTSSGLQHINLSILKGNLIAIVGRIGQGKSSLLSAIIGEMYKLHGKVQVSGTIAYVPQQAWIINTTLRDNILFGNKYEEERYQHILFACALEPDLATLPAGDLTEIGERGINLSGGQKQRISLARAAYENADLYLLDDPLSAVDAQVDRHLWENMIGPCGLLRNKTRVLVTHGIRHLKEMDQIVVLKAGSIVEQGSYPELMNEQQMLYHLIKEYSTQHHHHHHHHQSNEMMSKESSRKHSGEVSLVHGQSGEGLTGRSSEEGTRVVTETESDGAWTLETNSLTDDSEETALSTGGTPKDTTLKNEKKDTKAEQLVTEERMKEGNVTQEIILTYLRALSFKYVVVVTLLFIVAQACFVGTTLWLKHWIKVSGEAERADDPKIAAPSIRVFLGIYALLTFLYAVAYVAVSWILFAVARIRASELLHRNLISKVLRLPMSFFDTNPLGRILNRLSSDMSRIDDRIPNKFFDSLYFAVSVTSTFILIVWTTPKFIVAMPFLLVGYRMIQGSFLKIYNAVVRIYSVSKSPVYQHFNETLNGVSTIRGMNLQDKFIQANTDWADNMANSFLAVMITKRWAEIQLRLLSTLVLFSTALLAVLGRAHSDPSLVGLTLSFAMAITEEVTSLVRIVCDLQNHLIAVERVVEYTDLETEAPEHTDVSLPADWPAQGHIRFNNYSTRYRQGLDLVIQNMSIDILPGESIGIVGRTGAGKSSLTLALFRIIEAANSDWACNNHTGRVKSDSYAAVVQIGSSSSPSPSITCSDMGSASNSIRTEQQEIEDGGRGGEEGGSIEIDGIDISTVGLQDLRKRLAIIPQDPILFAGSVRENLDPFQELEDADLWEALERSHLGETIRTLPGGLSYQVSQNGENFSMGQRSLMCLARALLCKRQILVMDEATAAVDVETDELIQRTIRKEFKERTVLTIAHRIKTVMDSDKILVLEQGQVQEFERPQVLLQRGESSLFYRLAKQAGEI